LFAIFLPRLAERADTPTHGHRPIPLGAGAVPRGAGRGARVLLVEDDAAVRSATRRVLELAGFVVVEASNGQDALERLQRAVPNVDVVLTDVAMPVMNGRELVQAMHDRGIRVPVIIVSGYADPDVGGLVGAPRVLQKPLDAATLTMALDDALKAHVS
jgi:CheY-like chemotaxis protein